MSEEHLLSCNRFYDRSISFSKQMKVAIIMKPDYYSYEELLQLFLSADATVF